MKLVSAVALTFLVASSPALAGPEQLDLVCRGTKKTTSATGLHEEPFEKHYRLDLARAKYCEDDCRGIFDLVKVNPATIVIDEGVFEAGSYTSVYISSIDRITGEFFGLENIAEGSREPAKSTVETRGTCAPHPFSGFAHPDVKF